MAGARYPGCLRGLRAMTVPAVEFHGVTVRRARRDLVRDVSFDVPSASIHAVLGHNGAGKTTLMRALAGSIPTRRGLIRSTGVPSVLLVGTSLPREMTVAHLLEHRRRVEGAARVDVARATARCGVQGFLTRRFGQLSTGMAQRVAIAAELIADAPIIVLDEPTTGLDPQGVDALMRLLVGLRAEGRTIIICSHDLARLELVCDGVTCVRAGEVTRHGPIDRVVAGLPTPGHYLRTDDDELADRILAEHGCPADRTPRGLHIDARRSVTEIARCLHDQVRITEVTVDSSLFERLYRRDASAPGTRGDVA